MASRYDVVHTCSFPYFSLLGGGVARQRWRYRLVVDWFEVWSAGYWREYLGRVGGDVGWLVQRLCARVPSTRSASRAARGAAARRGLTGEVTMLAGAYDGPLEQARP